jgi:predicted tellurium resistance membrane protein TerC
MLELFSQSETWVSLLTLTLMEIVLGIDNIVFVSIVVGRLPESDQGRGRAMGLLLALLFRVGLLFGASWIAGLTDPVVTVSGLGLSGRDFIMMGGGLFLLAKSTMEIHAKLEGAEDSHATGASKSRFWNVIAQVIVLDVVFSIDSVITAVGLAPHLAVMVLAVVVSLLVMLAFAKSVSDFVHRHPTVKMLALSFLLMIGLLLFAEGMHAHVPKGYVYFAMAFSLFVEMLNMKMRKKARPVELHEPHL